MYSVIQRSLNIDNTFVLNRTQTYWRPCLVECRRCSAYIRGDSQRWSIDTENQLIEDVPPFQVIWESGAHLESETPRHLENKWFLQSLASFHLFLVRGEGMITEVYHEIGLCLFILWKDIMEERQMGFRKTCRVFFFTTLLTGIYWHQNHFQLLYCHHFEWI